MRFRIEKDNLGEMQVPAEAYYGINTLRSKGNFQITKRPISRQMIKGLATVKKAAAKANFDAGHLTKKESDAIILACDEILNGRLHGQFITDLIQGGGGSNMNMNANEVIANRANEMLGSEKGKYDKVHPINHVNFSQSANDVVPTAGKIATIRQTKKLLVEMKKLVNAFRDKANQYENVITLSKTHLIDNVPITFGQIFFSLASSVERDMKKIDMAMHGLLEINLGGTMVGTGINASSIYSKKVIKYISQYSGEEFYQAKNLMDASRHIDGFAWLSSAIKTFAINMNKTANDLRLMSNCFHTVYLPKVQPSAFANPGKNNAVILEMMHQVFYYMEGNDLTIQHATSQGEMELNVNLPIILACLFENLNFIRRAIRTLREKAIEDLVVLPETIDMTRSNALLITLMPILGIDTCEFIFNKALNENKSIFEVLIETNTMTEEEINRRFTRDNIVSSGIIGEEAQEKKS